MILKLMTMAGPVPVEITIRPPARPHDGHDVILEVGTTDSGTLKAHRDSWWRHTVPVAGIVEALQANANQCRLHETPEIAAVATALTAAALTALRGMGWSDAQD